MVSVSVFLFTLIVLVCLIEAFPRRHSGHRRKSHRKAKHIRHGKHPKVPASAAHLAKDPHFNLDLYTKSFDANHCPAASGKATVTIYNSSNKPGSGACECDLSTTSQKFPQAAISQWYWPGLVGSGRPCGLCFKLTVTGTTNPGQKWSRHQGFSEIIKVTDLCPADAADKPWCNVSPLHPNQWGATLHFDLNVDSVLENWKGVMNPEIVEYQLVNCNQWKGYV